MSLLVSALIVILADQMLKYAAFNFLDGPTVVFSFLKLSQVTNRGVAFGIGGNIESTALGKYFFVFLSLAIVGALLTLFARYCKTRLWARVSLGLIVGGAISNLGDRFMFGYVRDFIDFSFWPTFNAADLAICAGVVVLIAGMLKEEKVRKSSSKAAPTVETPSSQQES
jgi:signal peptidase II